MTATTDEQLAHLVSSVKLLMLDFDGPMCSVFAGLSASDVAERLRRALRELGAPVSAELEHDEDPLSVYRNTTAYGQEVTSRIFADLEVAETEAVASARPTPGAVDVLRAAREGGIRIAIVSNNAAKAVNAYLDEHGLSSAVDYVAARRTPNPDLMKPNPAYLREAMAAFSVPAEASALVGDSVTDIQAALVAGAAAVGYANKPHKFQLLTAAGAASVISSMTNLAVALRVIR